MKLSEIKLVIYRGLTSSETRHVTMEVTPRRDSRRANPFWGGLTSEMTSEMPPVRSDMPSLKVPYFRAS